MVDYGYVGRRRHPGWMVAWQVLTLGVYGRVWLYKTLRDLDGHGTLFLDRRLYLPLLILPFIGPFIVKRRVARIAGDLLHHDVTTPPFHLKRTILLGLVPWAPLIHVRIQRLLNHHWKMHTKEEELQLRSAELARLQKRARTPEAQQELKELEQEVERRRKELEDLRSAAIALREAERARREIEREVKVRPRARVGTVKKILSGARSRVRLPKRSSKGSEAGGAGPASADTVPAEPEDESSSKPAPEIPEVVSAEAATGATPPRRRLLSWVPKLRASPEERAAKKEAKRAEKERRKAEKEAARAAQKEGARGAEPKKGAKPRPAAPKGKGGKRRA